MNHIQSQIRHFLTFLAAIGGTLLSNNLIAPDQVEVVNAAGQAMIEPASLIGGAVAAGLSRLVMTLIAAWLNKKGIKIFSTRHGGADGIGRGASLLILGLCTAACLGGLPSCTTTTSPDGTVTRAPDAEVIEEGTGFARWLYEIWTTERDRDNAPAATEVTATK